MVATLCLLGCVIAPAQPADARYSPSRAAPAALRGNWVLIPRLTRAQEMVYRGTFTEECRSGTVQFQRAYRIETRIFVLDTPPRGADVAILTMLKHRNARPQSANSDSPTAASVRLERARVDLQGKVIPAPGVSLAVPLDGPPTIECGAFVEFSRGRIGPDEPWDVIEDGRPPRTWRVAGSDMVNGTSCLKLVGVQQSEAWDRPRADRAAWRRQDTVWLAPRLGLASRVERVIERREPAHDQPTQRSVLRYDLETNLQYRQFYDDRVQEITQALAFRDKAVPLLATPARYGPQLAALLKTIGYHIERQPPTPYREAVLQVKRRVEAARRGETPPALPAEPPRPTLVATPGEAAPDFIVPDFNSSQSARLARWRGQPILLVFYHPASPFTPELLRHAQKLTATYGRGMTVLGLSVADDAARVRKQRDDLGLSFPLLDGSGLRITYAVATTPKFVLLDAAGIVRGTYLGWGPETPAEIRADLLRWLPR